MRWDELSSSAKAEKLLTLIEEVRKELIQDSQRLADMERQNAASGNYANAAYYKAYRAGLEKASAELFRRLDKLLDMDID